MLADETSKIRVVGFETQQQKKLSDYHQKNIPIQLVNCEVKPARRGEGYDVLLTSHTKIMESPKKVDAPAVRVANTDNPLEITLDQLPTIDNFEKVTISVKPIDISDPDSVNETPHQDIIVADHIATTRVCLWGDNVNSLKLNHSYRLAHFTVREYRSKKYLNMARDLSTITSIEDNGTVVQTPCDADQETTITDVQIVGVPLLDSYKACLLCKARVEPITPPNGKCTKADCEMLQHYDLCSYQASAKLLLMFTPDGKEQPKYIQCHVFGRLLSQLANLSPHEDLTAQALLALPKLTSVTYVTNKQILTAFSSC